MNRRRHRYTQLRERTDPDSPEGAEGPDQESDDMNEHDDHDDAAAPDGPEDDHAEAALPVDIGKSLPPSDPQRLPLLNPASQGEAASHADGAPGPGSTIAQGMHFAGNATLTGPCSVGGEVEGHLRQAQGADIAVVITETGRVKGDIAAQRISVMGHTEGLLDAGTGEVSLHEGANVQGKVRYGRIQVNGADLNATLERVLPQQE